MPHNEDISTIPTGGMPPYSFKLVAMKHLALHPGTPVAEAGHEPVLDLDGARIGPRIAVIETKTSLLVAGLVAYQSATRAAMVGDTRLKVLCLLVDDVIPWLGEKWPTLEAWASSLDLAGRHHLLKQLLHARHISVAQDQGRRVAAEFCLSTRTLKRIRSEVRRDEQASSPIHRTPMPSTIRPDTG